ncbi:MAG: sensor histidine kinase [Actinocatenispora sp.]
MDIRSVRRWLFDGLLAGVLLLLGLVATRYAALRQPDTTALDALGYGLIVAASLPLVGRRRWPMATLAVVAAALTAYLVRGYPYGPIMIALLIAVYTVAATLPTRTAAVLSGIALIAVAVHAFVGPNQLGLTGLVPATAWVVVPFALGVTVRLSREATARARADAARRIANDERLRIAQEVHDVVGHGLSAITMQAEIALHLLHRKPEQAEAALTAIAHTSRQGLDELRATLTVLRLGDDRSPMPGLAQLPALRERLAHAGLPVTLTVEGAPDAELPDAELPGAVDLAAYRIVQEALTNVLRHAGSTSAEVRIVHRPGRMDIEVTDAGLGGEPTPGGSGIAGMRERATALGGTLEAGPRPGGGFRVHAVLPVSEEAVS